MTQNPLLSIAIPTYNRALHLDILLRSLARQLTPEIEILVADNAGIDDTPEILRRHRQEMPCLRWTRRGENIGFNRNYAALAAEARGRFLLVVGDDEIASPGLVGALLEQIRADAADILLLGVQRYTPSGLYGAPLSLLCSGAETRRECVCQEDLAAYFNDVVSLAGVFSFISNVAFRRETVLAVPVPEHLRLSTFPHAWSLLRLLRDGGRLCHLPDTLVYAIKGNDCKNFDDLIRRALLDIEGYSCLAADLFVGMPRARAALLGAVRREVAGYVGRSLPMALLQRLLSEPGSWSSFLDFLDLHGGRPGAISLVEAVPRSVWRALQPLRVPLACAVRRRYEEWNASTKYWGSIWMQGS